MPDILAKEVKQRKRLSKEGNIVVLVGVATSGKSSIISALRQLEPDRIEDGIDLCIGRAIIRALNKRFPKEFKIILQAMEEKDIIAAFSRPYCWKQGISDYVKKSAQKAMNSIKAICEKENLTNKVSELFPYNKLENEMFENVFSLYSRGRKVIFDHICVESFIQYVIKKKIHVSLRTILVHCPFQLLPCRIKQRNREILTNDFLQDQSLRVFEQFEKLYRPVETNDVPLEIIKRSEVII